MDLKFFPLALSFLLLSGCCQNTKLVVQTQYLNYDTLASYRIGTPDPSLYCPNIGQRLIINWAVPKSYTLFEDLQLECHVRFWNHEQDDFNVPLNECRGHFLYEILNEKYCETEGILTYRVLLIGNDQILNEWRHPLWAELIQFNQDLEESNTQEN